MPAVKSDAHWLADWCSANEPVSLPARPGGERSDRRFNALGACLRDGCVLVASNGARARAIAALDLDAGSVTELAFTDLAAERAVMAPLLAETERLAVRFGFDQIHLAVAADRREDFSVLGYRPMQAGGASCRAELVRSLRRRQTRYSRAVRAVCADLGIPLEYGRHHRLPMQTEATRLSPIGQDIYGREQQMIPAAARAWKTLVSAAAREGVVLQAVSAFRSLDYQRGIVEAKLARGQELADILAVSAAPGFSEHHTGCAVDITTPGSEPLEEDFEGTTAFAWLTDEAGRHGFRMSFPRNNRHGLAYEPWHWCYRG